MEEAARGTGPGSLTEVAARAHEVGLERLHILAWRDLVDVEAGGSELYMARIAERWAAAGFDLTMRTSYAQGHRPRSTRDGYRVIRRAGRNMVFPTTIIEETLRRHGPIDGLVEVWNGVPYFSPVWFRGPRVIVLHHVHREMWKLVLESDLLSKIGETAESTIAPVFYRRSQVSTLSSSSKQELVDLLHFRPDRISLAPPGVDPRFSPKGAKSSSPLVVAVGRLMPSKRFDDLIRVAARVRETVVDLQLVIAGEGYDRESLTDLIDDLGAEGWVTLAGYASDDEIVELYRQAWVVASASIAEGWGMTLTEAAACGTPAVARRIAGHLDAVVDGHSGLLAPDVETLGDQLTAVLTDEALRSRLTKGALEHAATLTWDNAAASLLGGLVRDAERRGTRSRR
jgi:glycosyltransferase involved in cell wall biosynthesis